jgi:uncharacterized membrane protein YbhN (UPF0104 family)
VVDAIKGQSGERMGRAVARRTGVTVLFLLGVVWASVGREELHHASLPLKVFAAIVLLPFAAAELLWVCGLVVRAAKEIRDWLWIHRENWRERHQRHGQA